MVSPDQTERPNAVAFWRRATIGVVLWMAWAVVVRPGWPETVLMLGPLFLVPLGLQIAMPQEVRPDRAQQSRGADIRLLAAACAAASFVPHQGLLAGLLTLPWLLVSVVIAITGVARVLSRRKVLPIIATDFGLIYLVVGAGWLSLSRMGANPLGFSDTIVLLTAVHFHYAGFALPIVAGIVASTTHRSWLIPAGVVVGVPFTAAGITSGGALEWVSATFMAVSGLGTAWLLVRYSRSVARGWTRTVIAIAGVALTLGMSMALGWAWSTWFGWRFLDVDWMARTHGSINAFGFGLLALIGLAHNSLTDGFGPRFRPVFHLGRASRTSLASLRAHAELESPTSAVGLLGQSLAPGYRRDEWTIELPNGFESGCQALRGWASHLAAGIILDPPEPPLTVGQTVAIAIPLPFSSISATCRIIETIDEPDRFGFVYATLPHHPEDGEESFIVERRSDGTAFYTVTAVWRPGMLCTRIGAPITRRVQQRTTARYLAGVSTSSL
jgi:uncharacterized protein (UPF0548 family)